jgi:hypothetical protein
MNGFSKTNPIANHRKITQNDSPFLPFDATIFNIFTEILICKKITLYYKPFLLVAIIFIFGNRIPSKVG